MQHKFQLYHWHLELSGKCTLKCPRCPRINMAPVPWINKELDINFIKKLFTEEFLKTEVKRITLCGDIGDPIYASDFLEVVEYIKSVNPKIHIFTITNGSFRKKEWWEKFAAISNEYDTINFSIDGYDNASNNLYRVGSNWDSIMQGMSIMSEKSKIFVNWAAIAFSFNQDHLEEMKNMAKSMGCDGFQLTHSTKFGSKYGDAYGGDTDALEPRQEFISKSHRYERYFTALTSRTPPIEDYMSHNLKQYHSIKQQYNSVVTPMCLIGNRGMYVSADGILHPCSWVSFPFVSMSTERKTIHFKDSFHQKNRELLNLNNRSLKDILSDDIWNSLFNSFNNCEKAWVECEQKCNTALVDQEYAVGFLTN